jgi:hypothetical protein
MKAPALKIVAVKCSTFWNDEFEIDPNIFDDIYLEAATRAIEKRKDLPGFKVAVMIECWEKKHVDNSNKHICYNTYFILINSGLHNKAEMLRLNFFKEHKIDLQKESLKPKS